MFSKFIAKVVGDKRQWRAYKARVRQLPESYRTAIDALERYLLWFGPGKGESIQAMLDDLADLFEQSAANGTSVRGVVGENPVEFAETFLQNYPEGGWITSERQRLNDAIKRAAGDPV